MLTRGRAPGLFVAAVACLTVGALVWVVATDGSSGDDRLLVVDEAGAVSLLDPATGASLFEVPAAVATPDRSALLTTRSVGERTVLESHDPGTGEVTGATTLDGQLTVRTVSPDGGAVALMPGPKGQGLYEPESRTRTSLTVSYTDDRPSRTYDLAGNLEPEMFSVDETLLFVLEFVPPTDPTSYLVLKLDLATGELANSGAPEVELNPRMRGKARAQILHPEGRQLYTLYTLPQGAEPVRDPVADDAGSDGARWAFVHVIDLEEKWSYCVFLPAPFGTAREASVGMGITPDGSGLYVADPSTSTIARIDTSTLSVSQVVGVEKLRASDAKAVLAVAGDGTLYVSSGHVLLELAPESLAPVFSWAQATAVSSLAVSASGRQLRVGGASAITLIDRASHEETAVLRVPGHGTVSLLGPPRGAVTEFPLECAC